jgi:signal transduction histidine kinase
MERLFDPFFTTKADGMGLGLSISRSIILAHGGELNAARKDPHGTKMTFSLPAHDPKPCHA